MSSQEEVITEDEEEEWKESEHDMSESDQRWRQILLI